MTREATGEAPRVLALLLGLIGDTLLRVPALRAVRDRYPDARITAVCDPLVAPALADNDLFAQVRPFDRRGLGLPGQLAFYAALRRERFDIALDFYYGARTPLMAWWSGAPRRIGPARGFWARHLFTDPVAFPLPETHMIDRHLEIVRPLGVTRLSRRWEFPVTARARDELARGLAAAGLAPADARDIVVGVGAGDVSKRWDEDCLREAVTRLAAAGAGGGRRVLLVADQRDPAMISRLWARGAPAGVHALPPLSLPAIGALFAATGLTLLPDSGLSHIAVATAPRLVVMYQATDPQLHRAQRPGYRWLYRVVCPLQPCDTRAKDRCCLECRSSLDADTVVAAASDLLAAGVPVGP